MARCAFYAVWGLLLEVAAAFGPVPRITWEHRGKRRNFSSVIQGMATTSGFLWDVCVLVACVLQVWLGVAGFAQVRKYLGPEYSKVAQALG